MRQLVAFRVCAGMPVFEQNVWCASEREREIERATHSEGARDAHARLRLLNCRARLIATDNNMNETDCVFYWQTFVNADHIRTQKVRPTCK